MIQKLTSNPLSRVLLEKRSTGNSIISEVIGLITELYDQQEDMLTESGEFTG
jgi:hypothetical protein